MADKDILDDAKERFRLAHDAESENRECALEDLKFGRLGEQWPEQYRRQREQEGRPCLTINRIPSFARQIVNDARQNKPAIRVRPADSNADPKTAEIYNGLIRNIEQTSNADVAYDTALESAVYCGTGYFRIKTDYAHDDTFDLDLCIEPVENPFTVYGDPASTSFDASSWRFGFVTDLMPLTEFRAKYGKGAKVSDWEGDGDERDSLWRDEDKVRVAEYWVRSEVDRPIVQLSDGMVLESALYEKNRALFDAQGLQVVGTRTVRSHKVTQHLLTGAEVLETTEWAGKFIPIVPVYGDLVNVEGKRYMRGLVREIRDSQQNFNYWRTSATELVALAPKAPFIGPEGAFDGDGRWATANIKSHPFLEYRGGVPPQRQPFAGIPAGAVQEALNASDDMKAQLGIYDASLGARSNETSGRAIMARQREGDVATFHYIDNLSRAIRYAGRCLLDLIPAVYDKPRMVRVLGEDGEPRTVPVNQPDEYGRVYELGRGKYDLIVETGPTFTSRREETQMFLTEVMRANPATAPLLMDVVARNMDFPEAEKIAARFRAMLPPPIQQLEAQGEDGAPPQAEVLMQQLAQAQQQMQQMGQALQQAQAGVADAQIKAQTEREKLQAQGQQHMQDLAAEQAAKEAELRLQAELKQAELAVQREQNLLALAADILKSQHAAQAQASQQMADDEAAMVPPEPDANAMALQQMMAALAETVAGLQQTMAAAAAPKRIVRDPATGRAMGVETIPQGPMQ